MLRFSGIVLVFFIPLFVNARSTIDVNSYQALTSDRRAYRIGDPVVVLVVESTSAESSAGTGVRKDVDIGARASDSANTVSVGLGLSGSDDGSGQTVRKGKVTTQISARIEEVLGNDLYRISGRQDLIVNGETQKINLTGIVRAYDISKNNTVMSTRIADAEIEIIGNGVVSDAQRKSIFYKVFKWLGIL